MVNTTITEWLNLIVVLLLALITFWYAKTTARIARDATAQADASRRAAEIMEAQWRAQRLAASVPIQITILHTLKAIRANRQQLQDTHGGIHYGAIAPPEYADALRVAKEQSVELYNLLSTAQGELATAQARAQSGGTKEEAINALNAAEQHLIQALERLAR